MAQPAQTFDQHDAVGVREDLSDIIYSIDPTRTPLMNMAKRGKATNFYTEWQTDELANVDLANAVIDGDDATNDAISPTVRVGNHLQISDKVAVLSGGVEAVQKAGRKKEMAYQIAKKAKELKRDMESIMVQNQASVAGTSSVAGNLGALESWLTTNVLRGSGGADGGFSGGAIAAPTDGTKRALTESLLKDVIRMCYTEGAAPTVVMCGPLNKQRISGFTGGSTATRSSDGKKVTAAVDVYASDFGEIKIIPNIFQRERTVFVLDPSLLEVAYLRPIRSWPLSKTGDSEKRQILAHYTLKVGNEKGCGAIADVNDS